MKNIAYILMLILLISLPACKKDDGGEVAPPVERKQEISFTVNQQKVVFESSGIIDHSVFDSVSLVGFDHYNYMGIDQIYQNLILANVPLEVGYHSFKDIRSNDKGVAFYWMNEDTTGQHTGYCDLYYTFESSQFLNRIRVEEMDPEDQIISGTFKMAIYREESCGFYAYGDTAYITDGEFYVKGW